jgi:hypothetical protein
MKRCDAVLAPCHTLNVLMYRVVNPLPSFRTSCMVQQQRHGDVWRAPWQHASSPKHPVPMWLSGFRWHCTGGCVGVPGPAPLMRLRSALHMPHVQNQPPVRRDSAYAGLQCRALSRVPRGRGRSVQMQMSHPEANRHGLRQVGLPGVQPEFEHLPLVQQPLVPASENLQISQIPYESYALAAAPETTGVRCRLHCAARCNWASVAMRQQRAAVTPGMRRQHTSHHVVISNLDYEPTNKS